MSFRIAIASGKGGTGKTTVAVNLSYLISKFITEDVLLVDCDVEEPNDALFFGKAKQTSSKQVFQLIPEIDTDKCAFCRKCVEYCVFNAIVVIPPVKFARISAELCHSCGACLVACHDEAIRENPFGIGHIQHLDNGIGRGVYEGRLNVGSAMQTMMIRETKKEAARDPDLVIFDAPPGTSCPVVESVADADLVILVTEPTPFGLHDLKLTVRLMRELKKDILVVINKAGLGNRDVYDYLATEKIRIIAELPFDREYASHYASGQLLEHINPEMEGNYGELLEAIRQKSHLDEGSNSTQW